MHMRKYIILHVLPVAHAYMTKVILNTRTHTGAHTGILYITYIYLMRVQFDISGGVLSLVIRFVSIARYKEYAIVFFCN